MANIDCNKDLIAYHKEQVTLGNNEQNDMRSRRDNGRTRLKNGLARMSKSHPKIIDSQGSYTMKTMVQDSQNEYDIDDGVYFLPEDLTGFLGMSLSPLEARTLVCDALSDDDRLKSPAEVKNNCVRQTYPQGYHIDYPVYRIKSESDGQGGVQDYYELASGSSWIRSDAKAVTSWFNSKVSTLNSGDVNDGSQLRRIVRYTKKFARSIDDWKDKTASGIAITKLVVDHFQQSEDRDDISLRETWKAIKKSLDVSTAIAHPVIEGTNIHEKNDPKVIFFKEKLSSALNVLATIDENDCAQLDALEAWDSVFNVKFFAKRAPASAECKKSAFAVVSSTTPKRDDGGNRFG